jgi:hypothetical protein
MDWIKQNRFLAGYLGVIIVGVLGLGFFAFKGWRGDKVTTASYEEASRKVDVLEKHRIFPNQENLNEKVKMVAAYGAAVDGLQEEVTKVQRELKSSLSEQDFRKLMNQEAAAISAMAKAKGMGIPEEFHFGLDDYESGKVINPRAIPLLEWEMDAIKQFVSLAAVAGIEVIEEFERLEFPQEDKDWKSEKELAAEKAAAPATGGRRQRPRSSSNSAATKNAPVSDNPMKTASKVMETYRFTAKVKGTHDAVRDLLKRIANDSTYFLWLRQLRIENEKKSSPRESDIPQPKLVDGIEPDENGVAPMIDATLLFGGEKVYAGLVIDVVRFKKLDAAAPTAGDAG